MKKVFLLIVALLVLAAIPVTVYVVGQRQELRKKAAPATTLSFTPSTVTKAVGQDFTLEVTIDTADNQVIAAELHITYDPEKLEAQTITNGPLFPGVLASGVVERGTASIAIGAPADPVIPVKGTGTAATVRFKALAATNTPVSVRFAANTHVSSLGEGSANVLVGTTPANITITGGSTSQTPESTPAATPTPIPTLPLAGQGGTEASPSAIQILTPSQNDSATSDTPTIQGTAPPGSTVTITIYSTPQTVVVTADANGNWTYTPQTSLESGPHSVVATTQDPATGATQTTTSTFVVAGGAEGSTETATPIAGNTQMTILLLALGTLLFITGILVPVVF